MPATPTVPPFRGLVSAAASAAASATHDGFGGHLGDGDR
jgi:hypothetical protein